MSSFDRVLVVDWSANAAPKTGRDSIWIGSAGTGARAPENPPTRAEAMATIRADISRALDDGTRLLIAFDIGFGFPRGFAERLTGRAEALAVWDWLAERIEDDAQNRNNRFEVAAEINRRFPGLGPFWGRPAGRDLPDLPAKGTRRHGHGLNELRAAERICSGAHPMWKLYTTGSVGSQSLLALAHLARLRAEFAGQLQVWPMQGAEAPVVLAETYLSLIAGAVKAAAADYPCKDAAQVDLLARALLATDPATMMQPDAAPEILREEGWILGAGHGAALAARLAPLEPPRLRNDCFAMPQGVDWVPVDEALSRLRRALKPLTGAETLPLLQAGGRVLASDCLAQRSNPPRPNSAVDGYGFAHAATGSGVQRLPLLAGRAAAGQPYASAVPPGTAVRILTGAILPEGVDTVVLEEDTASDDKTVVFDGPIKPGSNTRRAGEDVAKGQLALPRGHRLRPPDLALLAALGIARLKVQRQLRVGVLSTGDEIIPDPGQPAAPHQIWDANRPMLLDLLRGWGYAPVDLGHVRDNAGEIAARLDAGAAKADVILTSGGASAGDEDHVSRLLRDSGTLSSWRIALKPGRPLALALWQGAPVFGLPGNPVAALVCALIFARPALSLMAGSGWCAPRGFTVPAAFSKRKKPGRREYLRARLDDQGRAAVFTSEGSGRISGLSWATGLVELPDDACEIAPGTPVRYLPYSGFGIA
ncbi:gephyrin-like molybdotransferase Glp [Alkalilacustris brevis]|uniref:molybdopterin-binding protein n=1 Tax=Alkalilacustris brevis TaxID=2026338 RepID=UPI000E0D8345|nr:gephyrin-like molybdotransferase Glp [Alkalilacustris brevis]